MAEKNKEIVTLIGRRLREAATNGQASELPETIRRGLERLGDLKTIGTPEHAEPPPHPSKQGLRSPA